MRMRNAFDEPELAEEPQGPDERDATPGSGAAHLRAQPDLSRSHHAPAGGQSEWSQAGGPSRERGSRSSASGTACRVGTPAA
jgi:hypothetical protein